MRRKYIALLVFMGLQYEKNNAKLLWTNLLSFLLIRQLKVTPLNF